MLYGEESENGCKCGPRGKRRHSQLLHSLSKGVIPPLRLLSGTSQQQETSENTITEMGLIIPVETAGAVQKAVQTCNHEIGLVPAFHQSNLVFRAFALKMRPGSPNRICNFGRTDPSVPTCRTTGIASGLRKNGGSAPPLAFVLRRRPERWVSLMQ